jgi:CHAT domain-containing protein
MRALRGFAGPPKLLGRIAIAVVLVMLGLAHGYAALRGGTAGERLARTLLADRFTTGRLTGQTAWQACAVVDTAALVPRTRCGEAPDPSGRRFRRLADLGSAVRAAPQPDSSSTALRGLALLDLRVADTATAATKRAVASLEQAHRLAPDDAGLLNELAVAYLALGERTQQLTPMLHALDAIERAVEKDSARAEILFNRALIQQRLYLIASAARSWSRYLAVERNPRWRAEAQAHARWVAQVPDTISWDSLLAAPPARMDAATRAKIAARVERSPQKAREFGFPLLGAWGAAVQAGDSVRAARLLAVAREIGEAEARLEVDQGVRLAVGAIDAAAPGSGRLQALAEGHVGLRDGLRLYLGDDNDRAVPVLARSEQSLRAAESPAWRWAAFYHAAASVNRVDYESGDRILARLVDEASAGEPALAGKAIWALGLSQLRRGNYATATARYAQAAPYIIRSRERENEGAVAVLLAEGLALAGESDESSHAYRALRLLVPYRQSGYLNNHLAIVGGYARRGGLRYAALAVTDELVEVAHGIGKPTTLALALCARVRELAAVGHAGDARALVDEATAWADSIPPGRAGDRIRARVRLILGQLTRSQDAARALPVLAEAVAAYTTFGTDFYLPAALYEAAQAARGVGDHGRALAWLDQAMEHLEGQQSAFQTTEARATFYETVENVFDAAIHVQLEEARPDAAFKTLERGRIHALAAGLRGTGAPGTAESASLVGIAGSLPPGTLFLEYAVLPEELVVWTAARGRTRHHRIPVPRDSVARVVDAFARWASGTSSDRAAATRAYDLLVRPLAGELEGIHTLAVVPDRELYRAPFAALLEGTTGRFVVRDFAIHTLPSAVFFAAARARQPPAAADGPALVIGNPELGAAEAGALPPLSGAAREAEAIADLYPGSTVLKDGDARRGRVLELLPSHSVFHFAGHAVFDPERPERSYLALASDGPGSGGLLRAWEISGLRLSNVQVAVLSACSSLSPRTSRTGAVAGLAYSFLRAGVPATVSTLWDVDDASTTELVVSFHRHLAAGVPAAEALRLAQAAALASPRAELRGPQAWAGFIYTGP